MTEDHRRALAYLRGTWREVQGDAVTTLRLLERLVDRPEGADSREVLAAVRAALSVMLRMGWTVEQAVALLVAVEEDEARH